MGSLTNTHTVEYLAIRSSQRPAGSLTYKGLGMPNNVQGLLTYGEHHHIFFHLKFFTGKDGLAAVSIAAVTLTLDEKHNDRQF